MKKNRAINMTMAVLLIASFIAFGTYGDAGAKHQPPTHLIPCPNAEVDSSADIQQALVTAEPGETISLEACTYYLANAIVVKTAFHGALRGAGKDRTVFKILPGQKIPGVPIDLWYPGEVLSILFYFDMGQSGDITFSDFSMVVTDPAPAKDQSYGWDFLWSFFVISGANVNTTLERLRLAGSIGSMYGDLNVAHGLDLGGYYNTPMKGTQTISEVDFDNIFAPNYIGRQAGSKITITNNTYTNDLNGPSIWDCSNCQAEITSNKIGPEEGNGVFLWQGFEKPPEQPSSYLVSGNDIQMIGPREWDSGGILFIQGWNVPSATSSVNVTQNHIQTTGDGIVLADFDYANHGIPTLKASVSHNQIILDGAYGGIQLYYGKGALITNNRIAGSGNSGIYMGVDDFVDSCLLIGNNVNHVEASVAPIWLGAGTSHCIVIGGNTKANVLDQGTGNILIGVNKMHGAGPKAAILDVLKRKMELRKTFLKLP